MSGGIEFDIDADQLWAVGEELKATDQQVLFALSVALRKTATTLRTLSARGLKSNLELRTIGLLRKRLKNLKFKTGAWYKVSLWYGLNDMPASWFKGTPKKTASGAAMRGQEIAGGFVAKSKFKGRKTIFKREGKERLPIEEQNLLVEDRAIVFIEDEIFTQTEEIFWKFFKRDLNARVNGLFKEGKMRNQ